MSRFVRPSKYRHTYGTRSKVNYENAKISGSAWDTDLVTAGGKYIAVNWQVSGGGAFAVLPSFSPFEQPQPEGFPSKLPDLLPLARGHTAPVLDTAWSPFDDNLVVSGGEDGKIFVWKIDDGMFSGWGEDDWEAEDLSPVGLLNAGGRKVGQVQFHPAAANVLASASGDHQLRLWDIENPDSPNIVLTGHGDGIQSMCWNPIGTLLATTCRDRKLRLFDPRAGTEAVHITDGHGGIKGSRVVWLGDRDRIATTGFSKMSDRQLSLWDTAGLTNLDTQSLDSSAGVIIPFFAEGNDVLFLAGKGDGNIRYYEFEGDQFHFLNEYKSSDPQRGIGFIPRRGLDVSHNEIARGFKLSGGGIDPLSFVVPRKAEGFQSDIYPPANSIEPALSAADWFGGKTARPNLMDLETKATSANKTPISATPTKTSSAPSPAPAAAAVKKEEPKPEPKREEPKPAVKKEEPKPAPKKEEPKPVAKEEPQPSARSLEKDVSESESDSESSSPKVPVPTGLVSGVAAALNSGSKPSTPVNGASADSRASPAGKAAAPEGAPQPTQHELLVKLLTPNAKVPSRGSALSAGYDLYAAEDLVLPARGKGIVSAGIAIAIPHETYGRVAPRSGLAAKHGIDVGAGVIDCDYRGEVKVVLFNHNDEDFRVAQGDRIAQLILERIAMAPIRPVDELEGTQRGAGGFGSTGRA